MLMVKLKECYCKHTPDSVKSLATE